MEPGWREAAGSPACLFSRAGGQGLLPSSFPLRSRWQEAGRSADSHGEGISKAKGSFLALLQEKTRCFPLALSSCNPSPCPCIAHGRSRAQPGGPPPSAPTAGRKTSPTPSVHPSPSAIKPTASSGGQQPVSPSLGPRPLVPAPTTVRARGCRGDAQRTTRRSNCSARPARWCRASRCLFWTFSKCCSSSV